MPGWGFRPRFLSLDVWSTKAAPQQDPWSDQLEISPYIAISRCHSWGICEEFWHGVKVFVYFFPHPLRWFSVLELSLRQAGSGFRNLQLFFCYFLPLSWSWVGDKVAARPLKNNIGNVMEGKNNLLILSWRARSHFVESFFLCSMRSHIRELNKNYEWSFSFCKSKKFWLIHSIVAQREEGDTKLRWLIKKEEEKRVRRGK